MAVIRVKLIPEFHYGDDVVLLLADCEKAASHPSHHYVDIDSPAKTLILSVDEHLDSPILASLS